MADWAHVSFELRTPLVFVYLAWVTYLLLVLFVPRKVDSLVSFTTTIRRAYHADYLRRAGLTALFEDLTGPTVERADAFEKALASAGESDVKSVVLLAFKAFNLVRRLSDRPRFKLDGRVYLLPDTARVTAALNDLAKRESAIYLDAALTELDAIPSASFVREALIHPAAGHSLASRYYPKADELRDVTLQLQGLALVLASKLRSTQLQAKEAEYRPRNWVTVCIFTAAAAHLED